MAEDPGVARVAGENLASGLSSFACHARDLLRRLRRFGEAAIAYREALALVKHPAERRFLERRLNEVATGR